MNRYRFSIYWKWQIGINILYEDKTIIIDIPFICIFISLHKEAYGTNLFKEL